MAPRNKRSSRIVVRPLNRGERTPTKVVLGSTSELNPNLPVEVIRAEAIRWEEAHPEKWWWRESRSPRPMWRWTRPATRRGAGRNSGRDAWVSDAFVHADRGYGEDSEDEWEREAAGAVDGCEAVWGGEGRVEVSLLDIAKMAKPRGPAKEFEIVDTVPRVIALEDERELHCEEMEVDDWEEVEAAGEAPVRVATMSYAKAVLQTSG